MVQTGERTEATNSSSPGPGPSDAGRIQGVSAEKDSNNERQIAKLFEEFREDFERCGWKCMNTLEAVNAGHHACLVFLVECGKPCNYRPDKGFIIEDKPQPVECGVVASCLEQPKSREFLKQKGYDIITEMVWAMETNDTQVFHSLLPKHARDRFSSVAKTVVHQDKDSLLERLHDMGWMPDMEVFRIAIDNRSRGCLIFILTLGFPATHSIPLEETTKNRLLTLLEEAIEGDDSKLFWAISRSVDGIEVDLLAKKAIVYDREWAFKHLSSAIPRFIDGIEVDLLADMAILYDRGWALKHLHAEGWLPGADMFALAIKNCSRRCRIYLRALRYTGEQSKGRES